MSLFQAPYPPYDPTDREGFSYETVLKRWPVILAGIVDTLHRENHNAIVGGNKNPTKVEEGNALIELIGKLKYEMARDKPLEPIPEDKETNVDVYNTELKRLTAEGKGTWFTAPWLYAECYLYRLLRAYFAQTTSWREFDPFRSQKVETFQKSGVSIHKIATSIRELEQEKGKLEADPTNFKILFREMIQMCLWGNATDLSLLTNLSLDDIENLQSVGKDAQAARQSFILKDDQDAVWDQLKNLKDGRVDIVLDNSGFELFTDMVFADFLVTYTPYVSSVVFHPKLIPWFVSDVTPPDFVEIAGLLADEGFLASSNPSDAEKDNLKHLVERWTSYVDSGVFSMSVPQDTRLGGDSDMANFWTTQYPYWDTKIHAPALWNSLHEKSDLVVFKGDLNYRKLTGDIAWPADTPFEEAIGPLAGAFPILSLRTNKADVVVGVPSDVAAKLDASGEKWRVNGKYALISFWPKVQG
ncbi:DUF89 domain-containing protein [Cylindrobasidium torrendii FP15055 ss-10]|uniref:Sugar phosphate phosphatase n=1 Tax=Cylindrobasidium torrendii FP15055 ss-10 TaxID=1314674 RepID=A0A0D7BWX1_9AGAR|nr:DUF89 domain-containing protein [Cylindrobasidium torrendii FP15055 ss-10]